MCGNDAASSSDDAAWRDATPPVPYTVSVVYVRLPLSYRMIAPRGSIADMERKDDPTRPERAALPLAWRVANRLLTRENADCAFRMVGGVRVGAGLLDRICAFEIPRLEGEAVLSRVRGWDEWPAAWEAYAAACLREAATSGGGDMVSADAWRARHATRKAALALWAAGLLADGAAPRSLALARRSAALYRGIAPHLAPSALPVAVPYMGGALPGYLSLPVGASVARPAPLAVFLNGGSSTKEETNGWREPFLVRGVATLALDTPGTGEAWESLRFTPNQRALLPALRGVIAAAPALDGRIALVGISLGGMLAADLAAHDGAVSAVVAITPPFAPGEYMRLLSPLTRGEMAHRTGFPPDSLPYLVAATGLAPLAPRLTMPVLVIGAGRDRIVPPGEARRLYDALPAPRTLHWYPRASHCAFSHLPRMLADTARWLARTLAATA